MRNGGIYAAAFPFARARSNLKAPPAVVVVEYNPFFNYAMAVLVSIYKSCYPHQAQVSPRLLPLCLKVNESEEAFTYLLDQGKLLPFLRILDEYRVPFGLNSNAESLPGYGMQSLTRPHSTQDN